MNLKTVSWLGWMVTGITVCLMVSSCKTSLDTGEKTVTEESDSRARQQAVLQKMRSIIIPEVSFCPPATIIDAVEFFKQASRDFDDPNIPPEQRGISFILKLPVKPSAEDESLDDNPFRSVLGEPYAPVMPAMTMRHISLYEALKLVCKVTDMKFRIEWGLVLIIPVDDYFYEDMVTRTYHPIPPQMAEWFTSMFEEERKSFFSEHGVTWPKGSSLSLPSYFQIRIRNTVEQLELIEQVLEVYMKDLDLFVAHVEMLVLAFPTADIAKLQLAGDVSKTSLMKLWKAGKAKPVATASAMMEEDQETIVKAVQEVIYPSEWIWRWSTGDAGDPDTQQTSQSPKAWAFFEPQHFTMREVGIILQFISKRAHNDASLVKMTLRPQWVTLERWEPFQATSLTPSGKRQTHPATQPVFSVTSFETQVNMRDGDTVLIGTASTPDGKWVHAAFLTVKRVGERVKVREF